MRFVVTFTGRTLEFLDLESKTLHLRPRKTLELTQKELDEVKEKYPELFGLMFVHELTDNQKKKFKVDKVQKSEKKPVGRPSKKLKKDSDSDKS